MKLKFRVEGMSCAACSASVERVTRRIEGVASADVSLLENSLTVEAESKAVTEKICDAVEKAGFKAIPVEDSSAETVPSENKNERVPTEKAMKIRLFGSAMILVVLMYLTMGHMIGLPTPGIFHGEENAPFFALVQLILTLPIMYLNRKFYFVGFRALFHGSPNMDSLVAVGSGAAAVYGIISVLIMTYAAGHGDFVMVNYYASNLYFESAAMILTLVTVGKFLEEKSKNKTGRAVEKLKKLAPDTALVERDGGLVEIPSSLLKVGDIILIRPGESLPADGIIVDGSSFIDESALTGEPVPVEKSVGDRVISASINKNGSFRYRAERVGGDTTISKIIELVKDAGATKAPVAKLADKVSGVFVPVVIGISVITFILWMILGKGIDFSLNCAISVLVISCPCALGLATPVAITVGIGRMAERGILIKSAEALEISSKIKAVLFDKTGTITEGRPSVTDVISNDEKTLFHIASSIESLSEHPIGEAICAYCTEKGFAGEKAEKFAALSGRGVQAEIDGAVALAGNAVFMNERGISLGESAEAAVELARAGKTPTLFAYDGKLLGIIAVADKIKGTSAKTVELLKSRGIETALLTGDNEITASAIAKEAGIDKIYAGLLPEDKQKILSEYRSRGICTAFVGDGINDSPALAGADIGIAIGSGADIAMDSADIVLMKSEPLDIPDFHRFSELTMRNIKQNLFWAFFYNILGIPIAAGVLSPFGVLLSPMIGAAAMSLSSLFVVTNALRLYKIKIR